MNPNLKISPFWTVLAFVVSTVLMPLYLLDLLVSELTALPRLLLKACLVRACPQFKLWLAACVYNRACESCLDAEREFQKAGGNTAPPTPPDNVVPLS